MAQTSGDTRETDHLFFGRPSDIDIQYFRHQDLADLIICVGDAGSSQSFGVLKVALEAISTQLKSAIAEPDDTKLNINARGLPIVALPDDNGHAFSLFLSILFQQQQKLANVPSRAELLALAQLSAKYDLLTWISSQVKTWSKNFKWPEPLFDHKQPLKWVTAHEKMVQASFILRDDTMFTKALRRITQFTLLGENEELVWDLEGKLPGTILFVDQTLLPPGVAEYIKATKARQMKHFINVVRSYVLDLIGDSSAVTCINGKQSCKDSVVIWLARYVRETGIPLNNIQERGRPAKRKHVNDDPELQIISENLAMGPLDVRRISVGRLAHKLETSGVSGLCDSENEVCGPGSAWLTCIKAASVPKPRFKLVDAERAMAGTVRTYESDEVEGLDKNNSIKFEILDDAEG